jgi:hypothetical protein
LIRAAIVDRDEPADSGRGGLGVDVTTAMYAPYG